MAQLFLEEATLLAEINRLRQRKVEEMDLIQLNEWTRDMSENIQLLGDKLDQQREELRQIAAESVPRSVVALERLLLGVKTFTDP